MTKQIMFNCSEGLKDALGEYCGTTRRTLSEVIREAVAEKVGYDITKDKRTRTSKYGSYEQKQQAYSETAKLRRKLQRLLLDAQTEAEYEHYREALRATFTR